MPMDQWQKADKLIHKVNFRNVSKVINLDNLFALDKNKLLYFTLSYF